MTLDGRLERIAQAHHKFVDAAGGTWGRCTECDLTWPCPTYVWATEDRNFLLPWDPAEDDDQEAELEI